jgi:hypothetical protein
MRKDVYLKKEVQIDELVLNPLFTTGGKAQTEKAKEEGFKLSKVKV